MRGSRRFALLFALTTVATTGVATSAAAQTGLATITGIVSDASGAGIPGLSVTATNQATNIAYTGVTNEAGNYIITSVPIGAYVIAAELQGFKSAQSTVTLSAAQTARVDFKLQVGAVEERLEVVATGAVLQTENAVVGSTLNREQIEQLPVQGRTLSSLTLYTAGTTQPNMSTFNSLRGGGRPFVNGQLQQSNNFTLDGVDSNEAINNGVAYQPSPDAVEQVRVETLNYSAELGNVAGAVVNMVIKSGTNELHGNGFYYWRDNVLGATPWATNRAGGRKSDFSRNIFGGTIGGPIVRNRLFFFGDYQGGRDETPPTDAFATVVPLEWRQGDLSSSPPPLRDPGPADGTGVPEQSDPGWPVQHVRSEPVRGRDPLSVAQRIAAARRLPPELSRNLCLEDEHRPVRRESGCQRVGERQALRAVLAAGLRLARVGRRDAAGVLVGEPRPLMEHGRELEPDRRRGDRQRPPRRL